MPYILSQVISEESSPLWGEGDPYKRDTIYAQPSMPINYSSYTLKPHSLPHIESSAHTMMNAPTIDFYFRTQKFESFYGKTLVIKFDGDFFKSHPHHPDIKIWEVTVDQLKEKLLQHNSGEIPARLLISVAELPETKKGLHDPNHVLILSQEAANYLVSANHFSLYGTSWKSTDYNPGKSERPIHNTLFSKALILECLDLKNVPEGLYFLTAFPLPLSGASESPVCPVLFKTEELSF